MYFGVRAGEPSTLVFATSTVYYTLNNTLYIKVQFVVEYTTVLYIVKYSVWKQVNIGRKKMAPHYSCHFSKTFFCLFIMLDIVFSTLHNAVYSIVQCILVQYRVYYMGTVYSTLPQCNMHFYRKRNRVFLLKKWSQLVTLMSG